MRIPAKADAAAPVEVLEGCAAHMDEDSALRPTPTSPPPGRIPPESWLDSPGIAGRTHPEQVAGSRRNCWPNSTGISARIPSGNQVLNYDHQTDVHPYCQRGRETLASCLSLSA